MIFTRTFFRYFKNVNFFRASRYNPIQCNKKIFSTSIECVKTKKFGDQYHLPFIISAWFFSKKLDPDKQEHELITTIKRSILCIQREEYEKAERMLHVALKIAQDMQSKDGITYIYDVMANLAMERKQYEKAEALFTEVMKRLFADGFQDNDIKILDMSAKIAHMSQLKGELQKAIKGFKWTLKKIEDQMISSPLNEDLYELYGITKNWYGQLLIETRNFIEAKKAFLESLEILENVRGLINEESLTILNNISVACANLGENTEAQKYLERALELAKELPEIVEVAILKANLGLLYLKEGMKEEAKKICTEAYRYGKKTKDKHVVEQAEYCLDQIKNTIKN